MHDTASFSPPGSHVDLQAGTVSREAFLSQDVYAQEIARIFNRNWIFLAHESEIPNPGDYVSRRLGKAPVVVVRGKDGQVHAVLNSCRHRGSKVCRAESGNVRRFVCPYHGWTYETDGKLLTTTFDKHFPADMDFSQWGLVRVPKLDSYHGLIFGSWDKDAVSLPDYLGDFRWYLDPFVARSPQGMEVLAPPHRWRVRANWKVGALNFIGDSQHVFTTHVGPLTLNPLRSARAGLAGAAADLSYQVITEGGHGATLSYLQPGLPEEAYRLNAPDLEPLYDQVLPPDQRDILRRLKTCVGTVFPNLSFIETKANVREKAVILRQWHPISGTETEILSWVLAEREASPEYKASVLRNGVDNFGISGIFEQDDVELWAAATDASDNDIAMQFPFSFHTALPLLDTPMADHKGPGRAYQPVLAEIIQFEFMRHWDRLLASGA
jgi:PAH dioxygenase large subunit